MASQELYDLPISFALSIEEVVTSIVGGASPGGPFSSAAAAYAAALEALPGGYSGTSSDVIVFSGPQAPGSSIDNAILAPDEDAHYSALAAKMRYRLAGYSASGYMKIWYNVVTITTVTNYGVSPPQDVVTGDTSAVELPFSGGGIGCCIPGNVTSIYGDVYSLGETGVPSNFYTVMEDAIEVSPTEPPDGPLVIQSDVRVTVNILAWSCLPSYLPPLDGSANGFPPG